MQIFKPHRPRRAGFTLLELLVVIAIIGLLAGILVPSIQKGLAISRRGRCATNLHGCGIAMRMYLNDSHDIYPDAARMLSTAIAGEPSIAVVLRPYMDAPEILLCPADEKGSDKDYYYRTEGSSYEYNSFLCEDMKDSPFVQMMLSLGEEFVPVMNDYGNFHGVAGSGTAMNYLYMDGHVD